MAPAPESLVTRPLDELAGRICAAEPRHAPRQTMTASVGAVHWCPSGPAQVLLTIGEAQTGPVVELHLTPADVLTLAARLVRMAAAVHEAASK